MPGIHCGNRAVHTETTYHPTTESVRACFAGQTGPCGWLYDTRQYDEDGQHIIRECAAFSWVTGRGWECANGHEHVYAEVRDVEGWDYAADPDEAGLLAGVGVRPVGMDGGSITINPQAMAYAASL